MYQYMRVCLIETTNKARNKMTKVINEFTGKPYTMEDKIVLAYTVLQFPKEDAFCITKFSKYLEIDLCNGRHLYFAGDSILNNLLVEFNKEDIIRMAKAVENSWFTK